MGIVIGTCGPDSDLLPPAPMGRIYGKTFVLVFIHFNDIKTVEKENSLLNFFFFFCTLFFFFPQLLSKKIDCMI